jgi:hypothetical protein
MNPRFLAVCLWVIAGCFAVASAGVMRDGVRGRRPLPAAQVCVVVLLMTAVLANAGADLW